MIYKNILIALIALRISNAKDENFFCHKDFCDSYREKNKCLPVSEACDVVDNKTNGKIFSAEVPCGCCDLCMEYITEGDYCAIGSPDTAPPRMLCGPGLTCKIEIDDGIEEYRCRKMDNTACTKDQIQFDDLEKNGQLGKYMIRPICNDDGHYSPPVKCNLGQTCFCVDDNGKRLFGEALHSKITQLEMQCECSRLNDNFKKIMDFKYPVRTARCLGDGNYDPLQCMGNQCFCVTKENGNPTVDENFNMTLNNLWDLPCFDKNMQVDYKYMHDCEYQQKLDIDEIDQSNQDGFDIIFSNHQECEPDGWFYAINGNKTNRFCIDSYNRIIENFIVSKGTPESEQMNCLCARTKYLMKRKGAKNLPKCCPNGNFEKVQCRDDVCYCVDSNGLQIVQELPMKQLKNLPCYNNGNFC